MGLFLYRYYANHARLGEDLFDGFRGLLIGLSIGLNLWAVWVKSHPRPL